MIHKKKRSRINSVLHVFATKKNKFNFALITQFVKQIPTNVSHLL